MLKNSTLNMPTAVVQYITGEVLRKWFTEHKHISENGMELNQMMKCDFFFQSEFLKQHKAKFYRIDHGVI